MPVIFGSRRRHSSADDRSGKNTSTTTRPGSRGSSSQALEENYLERNGGRVGTFALCSDDVLKGQLSNLRTRQRPKGQIQIIDPDDPSIPISELPKGVRVSPDRAHAALICYHTATTSAGLAAGVLKAPTVVRQAHQDKRRLSGYVFRGGIGGLRS
jgi:hypothetical protein